MQDTGDDTERAALVALLRARPGGENWRSLTEDVATRSSALAVWNERCPAELFPTPQGPHEQLSAAARDIAAWRAEGLGFMTFLDCDFPAQLREIHEVPPVLFHRGKLVPDDVGMSVVGSRKASHRGLDIARAITQGLVQRDITVISGLAHGIDTAAHTQALEDGGRTVAIIGTGIRRSYPSDNAPLQQQIATQGLVMSQFWPDAAPTKHSFPMRNAVMSGYGRATIIVEAGEYSGARIQARQAVAHGRTVILTDHVVETNAWARALVDRPGVHVARGTADVMSKAEDIAAADRDIDELIALTAAQ
ncbi:DNA processing protein [Prauserella aidingensis]|uniref:DNA-processing protein DprA n=1 Tax=Prauserella aidingensis TaxID=387890 RepID=UPI0020A26DB2|nr:DNA-processing protein DprA [Prauserella aidingensis]MCP2254326.1 DNA processing protein [Prauserella aidingensis]